MILKVLLILFLVYFLVFRFFGLLLRPFMSFLFASQNQRYQSNDNYSEKKRKDGELRIDHVPDSKKKKNQNFDGGEYVDYEEVK